MVETYIEFHSSRNSWQKRGSSKEKVAYSNSWSRIDGPKTWMKFCHVEKRPRTERLNILAIFPSSDKFPSHTR
jgi:hypothetical protein